MRTPPIRLNECPEIVKTGLVPLTHRITIKSGPWTHTAELELPGLDIGVGRGPAGAAYILAVASDGLTSAEAFDLTLGTFAGAVKTAAKAHWSYNPQAIYHLLQGVASALVYFGQQYGYVTRDEEDTITATPKREDV